MDEQFSEYYWTPHRRELVQWFDERAPSFRDAYVAAVRLLHMPSFPARVHLICHLIRDIYRRLPRTLGHKALSRPGEVYPDMARKLADAWNKNPPISALESMDEPEGLFVNPQIYRRAEEIAKKVRQLGSIPSVGKQLAIALFDSRSNRSDAFIERWVIRQFDSEYDFFRDRAHLAHSREKAPNDDGLIYHFKSFERAFHSLVGPYFSGRRELDGILQETNATSG